MDDRSVARCEVTRREVLRRAARAGALATAAALPMLPGVGVGAAPPVPTPQWGPIFASLYGGYAEGYAYVVAQNGQVVAAGASGLARSVHENQNPHLPWATTTRMNLASVSKTVTAVATMALVQGGSLVLTNPFLPYIQSRITNPVGAGVSTVTIADLLSMTSAMVPDGTLYTPGGESIFAFLNTYLQQGLVAGATPGTTYAYSNTNFTILQAVIEQVAASLPGAYTSYADYVNRAVFAPMGVNTAQFSPATDPSGAATLSYTNSSDTRGGQFWSVMQCIGPGGWIAPATEVINYLIGIRNHAVLTAPTENTMFTQGLGWYPYIGAYGTFYHHNGGLINGLSPGQGLNTGVIHFSHGYDAVLLVNSPDDNIIQHMVNAFEAAAALPVPQPIGGTVGNPRPLPPVSQPTGTNLGIPSPLPARRP